METQLFVPISPNGPRTTAANMSDPKEKFYRHFQTEITEIQEQINDLKTLATVGGERKDCIETILAGISRLTNQVNDAIDFIPPYDQRAYSQAIKALTEKLNEATGKFSSKSRFQFKPRTSAASATAAGQQHDPRQLFGTNTASLNGANAGEAADSETRDAVGGLPSLAGHSKDYNDEIKTATGRAGAAGAPSVRKPSFSTAKNVALSEHKGVHIILPSSAARATSSGSLTDLDGCIVDMTIPTSAGGSPFLSLVVKDVQKSLLICGTVAGPVHITGVKNSVVVVAARQVRIHECEGVDFYLYSASHPIVEDCKDVRFAPIPEGCSTKTDDPSKNQWDQVDDFKWLKTEPSPNWSVLPEEQRLPNDFWVKTLPNPGLRATDILREAAL